MRAYRENGMKRDSSHDAPAIWVPTFDAVHDLVRLADRPKDRCREKLWAATRTGGQKGSALA